MNEDLVRKWIKAFKGRMGNLATRARTIETAVAIDRAGLKVAFEHQIDVGNGASRFVDVAALDAARQPVQFYQLYKATNIRPTMIRTGP